MTIIKRRILTGFFMLLFLVLAPIIIFYANGTIMGDGWSILASGGISIRSMESGSELFINGKLKDKISFFKRDYFLKNLKPDIYTILVKKPGYNEWTNKIKVHANMVSESNVFMLPTEITITEISKFLETGDSISTTTKQSLKKNPDYEMVGNLFNDDLIIGKYISVLSTTTGVITKYALGTKENPVKNRYISIWSQDKDVFIGWNGNIDSSPTIFCKDSTNINIKCQTELKIYSFDEKVNQLDFFPGESEVVIVAVGNGIYAIEAEENPDKKPQMIYSGKNPDFVVFNNIIYIKDDNFFGRVEI